MVSPWLIVAFAVVLYLVSTSVTASWRRKQLAKELGCKPVHVRPNRWPGGLDLMWDVYEASKRDQVPETISEMYLEEPPTWGVDFCGTPQLFTIHPRNIQAILATKFEDWGLGNKRKGVFYPVLGNGIFTQDGKDWEHSRALLRPQFTRDQVGDLEMLETHFQRLLAHIPAGTGSWTSEVDMGPLFFSLTLDSATEFFLGQSAETLLTSLPGHQVSDSVAQWQSFGENFNQGIAALGDRIRLFDFYWLYNPKSFRDNCKEIHRFADYCVNLAFEKERTGDIEETKEKKYTFLHELIKVTKDPFVLRSQVLNILIAGRDTTAGLLGWTFLCLARNPNVYQKLRQAVLDTFGTSENSKDISFTTLKGCNYLQYTMNETLRLFPPVPNNTREALRDTTLPFGGGPDGESPVLVPKGHECNYSVYAMHRRKDIWGPDAKEYNPDRWHGMKLGWEYLPFNGGPRICLGQQYALTEAGYVITRLVQKYDGIQNCDPEDEIRNVYGVTSAPKRVLVRLHEA